MLTYIQGQGRVRLSDLDSDTEDYEEAQVHEQEPGGKIDEYGDVGSFSDG